MPSLIRLQTAPALCHPEDDRRDDVVAGTACHIRDIQKFPALYCLRTGARDQLSVNARCAGKSHSLMILIHNVPCPKQFLRGKTAEAFQRFTSGSFHDLLPVSVHLFRPPCLSKLLADSAAAAHHSFCDQPLRQRTETKLLDAHRAGALSHHSDIFRIPSERTDIFPNPADRGKLIIQAVIPGMPRLPFQFRQTCKSQRSQAIINCHGNHAFFRPYRAVKMFLMAAAAGERAAVDIQQYREVFCLIRRPDVQKQTVLTVSIGFPFSEFIVIKSFSGNLILRLKRSWLITAVSIRRCVVNAVPVRYRLRIFPALCRRVADSLIGGNTGKTAVSSADFSTGSMNDRWHTDLSFLLLAFHGLSCEPVTGVAV